MRLNLRILTTGVLSALLSMTLFGCQRSGENVQAARDNKTVLSDSDKNFLMKAEKDNIAEQEIGRFAAAKTQNKDVKDYGEMLVEDHTKALNDLVDLMNKKGMAQPNGLPKVEHDAMSKLNGLSGPDFDREFLNLMVEDHQKAVSEFRQEKDMAQDKDVKSYADHVLPVLEKHMQKAQELQRNLASSSETKSTR